MISRRKFLKLGASAGVGLALSPALAATQRGYKDFSFGIVADLHYANKDARNNRYYRETLEKLSYCVRTFKEQDISFAVVLGDLVDAAPDRKAEQKNLAAVTELLSDLNRDVHVVLGNHDLAKLSKREFLRHCKAAEPASYYSFSKGHRQFIVLDGNFKSDGTPYDSGNFTWKDTRLPKEQLDWLRQELRAASGKPTFVFVHQNLHEKSRYGIKNAQEVRAILEDANDVAAVFQGHQHRGAYKQINGIHYLTLKALVDGSGRENNAFAIASIDRANRLAVRGVGKQPSLKFS